MPAQRPMKDLWDIIDYILRHLRKLERVAAKGTSATISVIAHALVGTKHTATGLSVGQTIRAIGATSFAWQKLRHDTDIDFIGTDDHHTEVHGRNKHTTAIAIEDEGTPLGDVLTLNFVGAGVTPTLTGSRGTITIPGGSGGGGTGGDDRAFAFFMG